MSATEENTDVMVYRVYARPVVIETFGYPAEKSIHSGNTTFPRAEGINALEVEFELRVTDTRAFAPGLPFAGTPSRYDVRLRRLDEYGFESDPIAESVVNATFPYGASLLTCRTFLSLPAGCLDGCNRFRVEVGLSRSAYDDVRRYASIRVFDFYLLDAGFSAEKTFSFTEAGYINPYNRCRSLLTAFHALSPAVFEAEALEKAELEEEDDDEDEDKDTDGDGIFDYGSDDDDDDNDEEAWPDCGDRIRFMMLSVEFRGRSSWTDDNSEPEFTVRFVYADGSTSEQKATTISSPARKDAPLTVSALDTCRVPALGPVYVELRFADEPVAAFVAECLPHDACDRDGSFSGAELSPIPSYSTHLGMERIRARAASGLLADPDGASGTLEAIARLDAMVGLDDVKAKIHVYMNLMHVHYLRASKGISSKKPPLHALFLGAPGTGKTSVAKLMGRLMKEAGVLSKGHVVIRERSQIVGRHYGDESKAMLEAIKASEGGVLFIDEAYTLYKEHDPKDPGREAVETLLSALADPRRRDWMVILGGYEEPTLRMFEMNPGLASRFPISNRYRFADYTAGELLQIAEGYCRDNAYVLAPDTRVRLLERLEEDVKAKTAEFGNARHILNLLETEILPAMASRIAAIKDPDALTEDCLTTILPEDIPVRAPSAPRTPRLGFRA